MGVLGVANATTKFARGSSTNLRGGFPVSFRKTIVEKIVNGPSDDYVFVFKLEIIHNL